MKNKSFLNFKSIGIIVTLAAAAILFVGCPDGNGGGDNADTDGDGIKNDEDIDDDNDGLIEIYTLAQLNNMRYNLGGTGYQTSSSMTPVTTGAPTAATADCASDTGGIYLCGYELMSNLDFDIDNDGSTWTTATTYALDADDHNDDYFAVESEAGGWLPIGDSADRFNAIFEGNHHTISNLAIRRDQLAIGLFGETGSAAHIRNIGITNYLSDYTGSALNTDIGGLVGVNIGTITASYAATGTVDGGSSIDNVGGLVGTNGGIITASYATGTVNGGPGSDDVGGLVGVNTSIITNGLEIITNNLGIITASYAAVTVDGGTGDDDVGGLVGLLGGTITASYATGAADGGDNDDIVGGLVGNHFLGAGPIIASYATGTADGGTGIDDVGGLAGRSFRIITASYATGIVNGGPGSDDVGGLTGWQTIFGIITASYATGTADGGTGDDNVGGLVGDQFMGTISTSYASGTADGGTDNDNVGKLLGSWTNGTASASYGFGEVKNEETAGISPSLPEMVTDAADLTAANAGSCTPTTTALTHTACETALGTWTSWNMTSGGLNAWDFGTPSQSPALRFAEYDGTSGTDDIDYCGTSRIIPAKFADKSAITCGPSGSLIPGQRQ